MSEVQSYYPLEGGGDSSPTSQYIDAMHGGKFGPDFQPSDALGAENVIKMAGDAGMTVETTRDQIDSRVASNDKLVKGGARMGYIEDGEDTTRPFFEVTQKQEDQAKREMRRAQKEKLDEVIRQEREAADQEKIEAEEEEKNEKGGEIISEEIGKVLEMLSAPGKKHLLEAIDQIGQNPEEFKDDSSVVEEIVTVISAMEWILRLHIRKEGATDEFRATLDWLTETKNDLNQIISEREDSNESSPETEEGEEENVSPDPTATQSPTTPEPTEPTTPPATPSNQGTPPPVTPTATTPDPQTPNPPNPTPPVTPPRGEIEDNEEAGERWRDVDIARRNYLKILKRQERLSGLIWSREREKELTDARKRYDEAFLVAQTLERESLERRLLEEQGLIKESGIRFEPKPERRPNESYEDFAQRLKDWGDDYLSNRARHQELAGTPEQIREIEEKLFEFMVTRESKEEAITANELGEMDRERVIDRVSNFIRKNPGITIISTAALALGLVTLGAASTTLPAVLVGTRALAVGGFTSALTSMFRERRGKSHSSLQERERSNVVGHGRNSTGEGVNIKAIERSNDAINEENIKRKLRNLPREVIISGLEEEIPKIDAKLDRAVKRKEKAEEAGRNTDTIDEEIAEIETELTAKRERLDTTRLELENIEDLVEIEYQEAATGGLSLDEVTKIISDRMAYHSRLGDTFRPDILDREDAELTSNERAIKHLQEQRMLQMVQKLIYERRKNPNKPFETIIKDSLKEGTSYSRLDRLKRLEKSMTEERVRKFDDFVISFINGGAAGGASAILGAISAANM